MTVTDSKQDRDSAIYEIWRPNSLRNIDGYNLNKMLTNLVEQNVKRVMHSDQTAFPVMQGCFIM